MVKFIAADRCYLTDRMMAPAAFFASMGIQKKANTWSYFRAEVKKYMYIPAASLSLLTSRKLNDRDLDSCRQSSINRDGEEKNI